MTVQQEYFLNLPHGGKTPVREHAPQLGYRHWKLNVIMLYPKIKADCTFTSPCLLQLVLFDPNARLFQFSVVFFGIYRFG